VQTPDVIVILFAVLLEEPVLSGQISQIARVIIASGLVINGEAGVTLRGVSAGGMTKIRTRVKELHK
jgi:hypothetical protein